MHLVVQTLYRSPLSEFDIRRGRGREGRPHFIKGGGTGLHLSVGFSRELLFNQQCGHETKTNFKGGASFPTHATLLSSKTFVFVLEALFQEDFEFAYFQNV